MFDYLFYSKKLKNIIYFTIIYFINKKIKTQLIILHI
jgi:hypothetical protein